MAPLPHWRATLAPGLDPTDVGDIELAEALAQRLHALTEEVHTLRTHKAAILREVADVIEAEKNQEPAPLDAHGIDSWRAGMRRAIKVLRMRADDLDPVPEHVGA